MTVSEPSRSSANALAWRDASVNALPLPHFGTVAAAAAPPPGSPPLWTALTYLASAASASTQPQPQSAVIGAAPVSQRQGSLAHDQPHARHYQQAQQVPPQIAIVRKRTRKGGDTEDALAGVSVPPVRRRKRDPALPKRATTAFVMFAAERRPSVLRENPGITFADVGRLLGTMWAEMTPAERLPYEQLVQLDRQRYEREMDAYLRDYQLRCQARLAAGPSQ